MVNIILGKDLEDTSHIITVGSKKYNLANTNDHGSNELNANNGDQNGPVNVGDVTKLVNYILNREDKEYIIVR